MLRHGQHCAVVFGGFENVPATHVNEVQLQFFHGVQHPHPLLEREAKLGHLRREAYAHQEVGGGAFSDSVDNGPEKGNRVLFQPPFIGSTVAMSGKKLCDEVAVGAVQFHTVHPCTFASLSGLAKRFNGRLDLLRCHFTGSAMFVRIQNRCRGRHGLDARE